MGSVLAMREAEAVDPLLTAEEVALMLKVSKDWVWDHSSRRSTKAPLANLTELLACPTSSLNGPSGTATDVQLPPRLIARERRICLSRMARRSRTSTSTTEGTHAWLFPECHST
jgi:hypothetical protein